jgi:hypothetical protein
MPYIEKMNRNKFDDKIAAMLSDAKTWGEINYCLSKLVYGFARIPDLSYQELQAAIGCLECAKLELYRRVVVDYENVKRHENGDVY